MFDFLKKALSNKILWYMATRYLTFGLQFVSAIYIAMKLGVYYWGVWSFILLLSNIGGLLNWGIGNSINILLVQHKSEPECSAKYCYNGFLLSCFIMIPMVLFTIYERMIGLPYFAKYHVGNFIYVVLLIVCVGYLNSFFVNVFRVKNRLFAVAFSQSMPVVASFSVMFFATGENLLVLLAGGQLAAGLLSLLLFLNGNLVDWKQKMDRQMMQTIFSKGFFLFCYNASFMLIVLSTKTIISYFYPVEVFGYFAFAFGLANAAMLLVDSFSFVAFPKMIDMLQGTSVTVEKIEFLRKCYLLCISGIVYLSIPGCWVLLRFMPKYQPAFASFVMIILALALYPLCYGYNTYILAQNKEKIMALFVVIALMLNVAITYFLANELHVSITCSILGIMIAYFVFASLINIYSKKYLQCFSWITLLHSFPFFCLIPFVIALIIALYDIQTLWILFLPLISFIIVGLKRLCDLFTIAFQLLKKPELLDIKNR